MLLASGFSFLNGLCEEVVQTHNFWTVFEVHAFVLILFIYVLVVCKKRLFVRIIILEFHLVSIGSKVYFARSVIQVSLVTRSGELHLRLALFLRYFGHLRMSLKEIIESNRLILDGITLCFRVHNCKVN